MAAHWASVGITAKLSLCLLGEPSVELLAQMKKLHTFSGNERPGAHLNPEQIGIICP